jgi:hypothetical protein
VPVPIEALEEVEELAPEEVVEEPALAVAVAEEPSTVVHANAADRIQALEAEVQQLRSRLSIIRDEQRSALELILRELNDLTERVRAQLEA